MKLHVTRNGCRYSPQDERVLDRRIRRLERRLRHFDPDLVHLEINIERQPRREEYDSNIRLVIMNRVFPAGRNAAAEVGTLLREAFDDLERQVDRFNAELRGEKEWRRKRGARSQASVVEAEQALGEIRARLDGSFADGTAGFDQLAETELKGLRATILEILSADGREPADEDLDRALTTVLTRAVAEARRKPDGWSSYRWAAWIAQRELRREVHD